MIQDAVLSGVTVVDLTQGYAGPYGTRLLADYGADVIKVEPPGGDYTRQVGPYPRALDAGDLPESDRLELSGTFLHLNRNKRSVVVDIGRPGARSVLRDLFAHADIIVESWRPGTLQSLGFAPGDLLQQYPGVVLCSLTPFGQDGPYHDYDMTELVAYAMGGPMNATGVANAAPVKLVGNVVQTQAGNVACTAMLGALYHARQTGRGQHVDVSWFETQSGTGDRRRQYLIDFQYSGIVTPRNSTIGSGQAAPGGTFTAADGREITTGPVWPDHVARMVEVVASPRLSEIFSGGGTAAVLQAVDEVNAALTDWVAGRTARQAMREAQRNGWPVVVVNSPRTLLTDDHLVGRDFWVTLEHPVAGPVPVCGPSWRLGEPLSDQWEPAPTLGQHTGDVLTSLLGYTASEADGLRRDEVIA